MARSNLPPLTWLRAFEASARHLSFTRAAGELNLTQSAISQQVRSLETFLGREVFVRKTRALELTEAGANYLPVVREAFDLLATGTRAFRGGDRGRHLVIQCNMAFSVFWLGARLPRLYARHPWLVMNVVTPVWDPERHAGDAMLEIRFGRAGDMAGDARRLTRETFYPVCHPDLDPDPARAPLFDCAGITGTWEAWHKSRGEGFARGEEINLGSTYVISHMAALSGAGLAMSHDSLSSGLLAEGRLVRPFAEAPTLTEAYFLRPPPEHGQTPATRAFLDWLWDEIAQPL